MNPYTNPHFKKIIVNQTYKAQPNTDNAYPTAVTSPDLPTFWSSMENDFQKFQELADRERQVVFNLFMMFHQLNTIQSSPQQIIRSPQLANSNLDRTALRHSASKNPKHIQINRGPYETPLTDQYDTVLNIPLVQNGEIQCSNLIRKVKHEMKTRGISRKLFARKVLGRTYASLDVIFGSSSDWKELGNRRKQMIWNLYQWVNASDSDKKAIINGDKVSDVGIKLYTRPHFAIMTTEQCQQLKELCQDGNFPGILKIPEIARRLDLEERVVINYVNSAKRRLRNKKKQSLVSCN